MDTNLNALPSLFLKSFTVIFGGVDVEFIGGVELEICVLLSLVFPAWLDLIFWRDYILDIS